MLGEVWDRCMDRVSLGFCLLPPAPLEDDSTEREIPPPTKACTRRTTEALQVQPAMQGTRMPGCEHKAIKDKGNMPQGGPRCPQDGSEALSGL